MPQRQAIGTDPLDWVGKGHEGEYPNHDEEVPPANSPQTPAPAFTSHEDSKVPLSETTSLSLEREILLMQEFDHPLPADLRSPRSRSPNQVLLLLIFLATFIGTGLFFFFETQKRWNNEAQTLKQTIQTLERNWLQSEILFQNVVQSKNQVIQEKDRALRELLRHQKISTIDHEETAEALNRLVSKLREIAGRFRWRQEEE